MLKSHSMTRVGRCIDNGPMESFGEPYNVKEGYETFEALQQTIKEYSVL